MSTEHDEQDDNPERKDVQCADCFEWFDHGDNHTCRQQIRANHRRARQ